MNRTNSVMIVASLAFAVGCTQGTNPRTTIGQHQSLPALTGSTAGLSPATGASVAGLDRSHWEMDPIIVAPDGSRAWFWRIHADNRHDGAHPTALTALDTDSDYGIPQILGIPLRDALGEGLLLPHRLTVVLFRCDPPEQASGYERSATGTWRDSAGSTP